MSDVRNKANNLNTAFPIPGVNNSSKGFSDNTIATQQALFQAGDEIDKLQGTRFTFSGDATGSSNTIGNAVVVGANPPTLEIPFTLTDVRNGPNMLDTRYQDIALTIDSKGRVTNTTVVSSPIAFDPSHAPGTAIGSLGSAIGSGSGSIVIPTFTFNTLGRLTATGTRTISFGLREQRLTYGALLVGQANNQSAELLCPPAGAAYSLIANGPTLSWQAVSTGTVTGVVAGTGIHVVPSDSAPTVSLDLSNLTASAEIIATDFLPWQDVSDGQPKNITLAQLQNKIVSVQVDPMPKLGGNLDVGNFAILSNTGPLNLSASGSVNIASPAGVNLLSNITAPKSTLSVTDTALTLLGTGPGGLTLNGLLWPAAGGAAGQFLTQGPNNTLTWSSTTQFYQTIPNTKFVSTSGDDATGNGSLNNPYKTISKALSVTPTNNTANTYTVMLLGGVYAEDVAFSNIRNIALEGFFGSSKSIVTGHMEVQFNVDKFLMSNVVLDSSADDLTIERPTFSMASGVDHAVIRDCDFLRGPGDKSNLSAVNLSGQIVGDIQFTNCTIQGKISNNCSSEDGGRVVFQNSGVPTDGWTGLETATNSSTFISGHPLMKGVRHNGGYLVMENVGSIAPENYSISTSNPALPLWTNGSPVFEVDQNGDPIPTTDDQGNTIEVFLLDPQGNPIDDPDNAGQSLTTHYVQKLVDQPPTVQVYTVGLYSTALADPGSDPTVDNKLELTNVNFYNNGEFSKLYKSGDCIWSFTRVKRRSDQDYIVGPRLAYDVQPDEGNFMAHYVASGSNLRYEDSNATVPNSAIDPQSGNTFLVTLTNSATLKLKTPLATAYAPGPLATSGELYSEVLVCVRQDATGGRNVAFTVDAGAPITWISNTAPNIVPGGLTFFLFRYFSRTRTWVGQKQVDASGLKVTPATTASYQLLASDAGSYIRRSNSAANQVVVPNNTSVQFNIGVQIQIVQIGTGQTEIVAGNGVVINTPDSRFTRKRFSQVTLTKVANNTWDLTGDLDTTKTSTNAVTADDTTYTADNSTLKASNG